MSEKREGWSGRLRRLVRGTETPAPRFPGRPARRVGAAAIEELAAGLVDAIADGRATRPARRDPAAVERNVFGGSLRRLDPGDAPGAVAAATGAALAGLRATAFVDAEDLPAVAAAMRAAVERQAPFVLQAWGTPERGGHEGLHAIAATGAFVCVAWDLQHAIDLTLAAHRVAERALLPGVVLIDPEIAWGLDEVRLPEPELLRERIGDAGAEIEAVTPAQRLLFGERRRRVPRWFDLDRPLARAVFHGGSDHDAALSAKRAFFSDHLPGIVRETLDVLAAATGRPQAEARALGGAVTHHAIVALGAGAADAAEFVLRTRGQAESPVGVVGVAWLRPFPAEPVREALADARRVVALERLAGAAAESAPLLRELRPLRSGAREGDLLGACYTRPDVRQVGAVCANLRADAPRMRVRLGVGYADASREFPRQEALLHRVRREYPQLEGDLLPSPAEAAPLPEGTGKLVVQLRAGEDPATALARLAEAVAGRQDGEVRGRATPASPAVDGLWQVAVTRGAEAPPPDEGLAADLLVVTDLRAAEEANPLQGLRREGTVVFCSASPADELARAVPEAWRKAIRWSSLRVAVAAPPGDELPRRAAAWLAGEREGLRDLEADLETHPPRDVAMPLAVRRLGRTGTTLDSPARFWGEFAQPRLEDPGTLAVPDPFLASGTVPSCTSTFQVRVAQREQAPSIDPSRCTGCGRCWTSCPDSALAPLAISTERLLDAAADRVAARERAAPPDPSAARLRRVHRQLAARVDRELAEGEARALAPEPLRAAFAHVVEKMGVEPEERAGLERAFERSLAELEGLPFAVTAPFFRDPHGEKKGSGELLLLAVSPQACQGCGICAAVCPEAAIEVAPQDAGTVARLERVWGAWETLPDTPGETIARAAHREDVGPLAAVLLSRHCQFAIAGGDAAERGSGARLALRQVAAVIEHAMQRRMLDEARALEDLSRQLGSALEGVLARAVEVRDLARLDVALAEEPSRHAALTRVLGRLEELGERPGIDVATLHRLVRAARAIEHERWRVAEGATGAGRARFGVVLAGRSVADWAARFPFNPFSVPVEVDLAGDGVELAAGLLAGLEAECVRQAREARRARLYVEGPADLPLRDRQLDALEWADLTPEEASLCPPVLVVGAAEEVAGAGWRGLSRLLSSARPLKVLLLDGRDLASEAVEPALLALAHRTAFTLATSIAHPAHLFRGVQAAVAHPGPALIHVHAPSPRRHGFPTNATVERARLAVDARVHPLLCYDPAREGVFGTRIDLEGNPDADAEWAAAADGSAHDPATWAAGEARYAASSSDPQAGAGRAWNERRAAVWSTLQELAGRVTPFTETLRASLREELEAAQRSELAAVEARHRAEIEGLRQAEQARHAARLRERLLRLAGHPDAARDDAR